MKAIDLSVPSYDLDSFEIQDCRKELLSTEAVDACKSNKDHGIENPEDDVQSDQVPTFALHDNSSIQISSGRLSNSEVAPCNAAELHEPLPMSDQTEVLLNSAEGSPDLRRNNAANRNHDGKGSLVYADNRTVTIGPRSLDNSLQKVKLHLYCCIPSSW